jgi:RNA-directed DNA polymerase
VDITTCQAKPATVVKSFAPLEGRLAHLLYVKRRRDLDRREAASAEKSGTLATHVGIDALYRRFLVYKHFVAASRPILVTEGKTDITYLSCAIRALASQYTRLASVEDGRTELAVAFVPASYVTHKVLRLLTGYGDMLSLLSKYEDYLRRYRHASLVHPAIFVVDNDSGGGKLFKEVRDRTGAPVNYRTTPIWHHIKRNLYLLRTPPKKGAATDAGAMTAMEDLFSEAVRGTMLGGKRFDPAKPHADQNAYGKAIFADQVIRPGIRSIDFSAFAPMLEAIIQIMDNHAAAIASSRQATASVASS